jgi:hypothetical protein
LAISIAIIVHYPPSNHLSNSCFSRLMFPLLNYLYLSLSLTISTPSLKVQKVLINSQRMSSKSSGCISSPRVVLLSAMPLRETEIQKSLHEVSCKMHSCRHASSCIRTRVYVTFSLRQLPRIKLVDGLVRDRPRLTRWEWGWGVWWD